MDDLYRAMEESIADLRDKIAEAKTSTADLKTSAAEISAHLEKSSAHNSLAEATLNPGRSDTEEVDPQEGPSGTQIPPKGTPPRELDSSDDDIDRLLQLVSSHPELGQEIINKPRIVSQD